MAIKSGEIITASELDTLKTNIKTMYSKRGRLTDTQKGYAGTALNTSSITTDSNINEVGDIVNACLVINDIPNLKFVQLSANNDYINSGEYIFGDGTSTDLSTWLTTNMRDATTTSSNHGCRGECVGLCTGDCYGTCVNGC